jgi:hypothetical protein
MILSLPGCSKIVPEQFRLLETNTITGRGGGGKLTTAGKTQMTTIPMATSGALPCDDEKSNGNNRKQSGNPLLTINSTNRLLSVPNTINSSSVTSFDEDSPL